MSEEQDMDKKAQQDQGLDEKTQVFLRCEIHNISYPQGTKCPECEKNQQK